MVFLSATAQAQADTSKPLVIRGITSGRKADSISRSDSIRASDIESVEVIKGPAASALYRSQIAPDVRRRMLDTVEAQRALWAGRRPRVYIIRMLALNECIAIQTGRRARGELLVNRIVVRDTTVVGREMAPMPDRFRSTCPRGWRVDDVFADVANALADTTAYIANIQYDPVYGFPRKYWVVRGMSRGEHVIVESFAPELPSRVPRNPPAGSGRSQTDTRRKPDSAAKLIDTSRPPNPRP